MIRYIEAVDERARSLASMRTFQRGYRQTLRDFPKPARDKLIEFDDAVTWHQGWTVKVLSRAESYWMSAEMWQAITASSQSLPLDLRVGADLLPAPAGWVWLEEPWPIPDAPSYSRGDEHIEPTVRALSWGVSLKDNRPVLIVETFHELTPPHATRPVIPAHCPMVFLDVSLAEQDASLVPVMGPSWASQVERFHAIVRAIVATFLWIRQTICVITPVPLERHAAKRLLKAEMQGGLSVITLRRHVSEPKDATGAPIEWSCRWIVNGHWRKQFYPSKEAHEYIWILPFVKGPEDKPLKTPDQKVFAIIR
jgi:hypothetical protein